MLGADEETGRDNCTQITSPETLILPTTVSQDSTRLAGVSRRITRCVQNDTAHVDRTGQHEDKNPGELHKPAALPSTLGSFAPTNP